MKRSLAVAVAALVLLTGCNDTESSTDIETWSPSETSEISESVASTTASSAEVEFSPSGVSLAEEHRELKAVFGGADEYCDFEELGVSVSDITIDYDSAMLMMNGSEEYWDGLTAVRTNMLSPPDGGLYFFCIEAVDVYESDDEYISHKDHGYFIADCNTGELTRIYPDADYDDIVYANRYYTVSSRQTEDGVRYRAVRRNNGIAATLPKDTESFVIVEDNVYYDVYDRDTDTYTLYCTYIPALTVSYVTSGDAHYPVRGAGNMVYSVANSLYSYFGDGHYAVGDPRGRIRDYPYNTCYAGSIVRSSNALGYTYNIGYIGYNNKEIPLGTHFSTRELSLDTLNFHITDSKLVYFDLRDGSPIVMRIDSDRVSVAFLPDEYKGMNVACDGGAIYLYNNSSGRLVTLV